MYLYLLELKKEERGKKDLLTAFSDHVRNHYPCTTKYKWVQKKSRASNNWTCFLSQFQTGNLLELSKLPNYLGVCSLEMLAVFLTLGSP